MQGACGISVARLRVADLAEKESKLNPKLWRHLRTAASRVRPEASTAPFFPIPPPRKHDLFKRDHRHVHKLFNRAFCSFCHLIADRHDNVKIPLLEQRVQIPEVISNWNEPPSSLLATRSKDSFSVGRLCHLHNVDRIVTEIDSNELGTASSL